MSSRRGFTLVELMLTVAVIGLLTSIAIPAFLQYRHDAEDALFTNDMRIMMDAFRAYFVKHSAYPVDVNHGVEPAAIAAYLPQVDWAAPTPIGGLWDWEGGVFGIVAGVSVLNPDRTLEEMKIIDSRLDDGNLSTGRFRRLNSGRYTFVLDE